jgi:hypothetical protein
MEIKDEANKIICQIITFSKNKKVQHNNINELMSNLSKDDISFFELLVSMNSISLIEACLTIIQQAIDGDNILLNQILYINVDSLELYESSFQRSFSCTAIY